MSNTAIANHRLVAIDLETTGFNFGGTDRVVEVALVQLEPGKKPRKAFSSLVNPRRDVGPVHVHGISATEVRDAPTFAEVAGDIATALDNAILVAHNARFDLDFLRAEYERLGVSLPGLAHLCTLNLAQTLRPDIAVRKLAHCCRTMHVSHSSAHSALGDATATADLFNAFFHDAQKAGWYTTDQFGVRGETCAAADWCSLPPSGLAVERGNASTAEPASETAGSFIAALVERLPPAPFADPTTAEYLNLLDRSISDREITEDEADQLLRVAMNWGLTRPQVFEAHHSYLVHLCQLAMADHVVTADEHRDLLKVVELLGLHPAAIEKALHDVATWMDAPIKIESPDNPEEDLRGSTVCFTGEFTAHVDGERVTRDMVQSLAVEHGLFVRPSVTKALDILVLQDVGSMSSKAKKARKYGVRLVSASDFFRAIGVEVQEG